MKCALPDALATTLPTLGRCYTTTQAHITRASAPTRSFPRRARPYTWCMLPDALANAPRTLAPTHPILTFCGCRRAGPTQRTLTTGCLTSQRGLFFYACALGARVPHTPAETYRGRQKTVRRSSTASSNRGKISLCVAGADRNRLLRRPVPPSVAKTRENEALQLNVRPRKGKGKPMPTRALSAHALSGGLCVAGVDRNRLLRRPVPPSVAQTRGSEGPQK